MDNKLLDHHIVETRHNFAQVHKQLDGVTGKLDDLGKFKIEMLVSARWTSLVVSAILGFVTMIVTTYMNVKVTELAKAASTQRVEK